MHENHLSIFIKRFPFNKKNYYENDTPQIQYINPNLGYTSQKYKV